MFDIKGLHCTVGNRARYQLSYASKCTAPVIQRLLDAGANLLGTLKLGSFITKEEPTESQDFHAPFNPRADGYQSAWSSSGGSGAAIASYDWLDFTIGTDTTGSSRRPAMANGCFQLRVTHGALPLDGVVPSWSLFDAPAVFTRDIACLEKCASALLETQRPLSSLERPVAIIYFEDFFPVANTIQQSLIEDFLGDLEFAFGTKRQSISITRLWNDNLPAGPPSDNIQEYLQEVSVP